MKRYKVLRRDFLKIIVITTVCTFLASCGAKNPVTAVSPATEVPATEISVTEVPATEVPATEIPATEIPATEAETGAIVMPGDRVFPEGVAGTSDGTFFAGSLEEGTHHAGAARRDRVRAVHQGGGERAGLGAGSVCGRGEQYPVGLFCGCRQRQAERQQRRWPSRRLT